MTRASTRLRALIARRPTLSVIPAEAGIPTEAHAHWVDSRLRGNDSA